MQYKTSDTYREPNPFLTQNGLDRIIHCSFCSFIHLYGSVTVYMLLLHPCTLSTYRISDKVPEILQNKDWPLRMDRLFLAFSPLFFLAISVEYL